MHSVDHRSALQRAAVALALIAVALAAPRSAVAQGAAVSTNIGLSVRAAGMGASSTAVTWGEGLDSWANPALLGYASGLRYEDAHTRLIPDFADDVFFDSKRVTVNVAGVGVLLAGRPIDGFGSVRLDYGASEATSSTGEPLGTFHAYEDVETWGVGVSVGRLARALARAGGHGSPRLLRYADVAVGMNHKDVTLLFAPEISGLPGSGAGKGTATDRGLLARLTPYDGFAGPGGRLLGLERRLRVVADVAFGTAVINRGQPEVVFPDQVSSDPMMAEHHHGWAAHVAVEPRALEHALSIGLSPLLSVGGAWDRVTLQYQGYDPSSMSVVPAESHIADHGYEVSVLNLFSYRHGHVSDPDGSVDGPSSGWSLGYTFRRLVGFRYDHATIPQATDPTTGVALSDVHRRAWSVTLDPLAFARQVRRGGVQAVAR